MMEDSNHQDNNDNDIDMNNDNEDSDDESEIIIEDEDSDDEYDLFSSDTFKRLKQNDPSLTAISVDYFRDHEYTEGYFKSINWKENVCCIANNTHLKSYVYIINIRHITALPKRKTQSCQPKSNFNTSSHPYMKTGLLRSLKSLQLVSMMSLVGG